MVKKTKEFPKISIIIPSYNKGPFIQNTLESIMEQKYPNLEVIIQDGGSNDGSLDIIKQFARKYPKILQWVSKKDKGQTDAINKGLKKAKGEIVTYINADDVFKKNALNKVGKYFIDHPNSIWVMGLGDIIDDKGKRRSVLVTYYKNFLIRLNMWSLLLMVNYITQPSVFWKKSVHENLGFLTGGKKYVMEYGFWLKLMKLQKPGVINDYLSSFRLISGSASVKSFKELLALDYQIVREYTDNFIILALHFLHNLGRVLLVVFEK